MHAANLALRFVLEIIALVAVGYWGFRSFDGWLPRIVLGIGLPVALAAIWAVFRVPGDGGDPIVVVSGQIRLAVEALVFATAVLALALAGQRWLALTLLLVLLVHYGIDHERTIRLLMGRQP